MKKLTFWSSVATIAGFFIAIFTPAVSSQNQTSHGDQSPNINSTQGDVNITFGGTVPPPPAQKQYVLRQSQGGAITVLKTPNPSGFMDNKQHVCIVISGTPIEMLDGKASQAGFDDVWREIKITSGSCADKVGWVMVSNISFE